VHLEHLERIINRATIGVIVAALVIGLALVFLATRI